jgi:hypothetical protein
MHKLLYINHKDHSLTSIFDTRKIKFEKQHQATTQTDDPTDKIIDETAWNPEMENLIWYKNDVIARRKDKEISDSGPNYGGSFIFSNKEISVLKHAVNINNYRIAEEADGSYSLLFKTPNEKIWGVISRFAVGIKPPLAQLKKLVNYLVQLSKRSEGFYIVEHLLLRPDMDIEVYGFKLCIADTKNGNGGEKTIFRSNKWLTFEARKEVINKLLKFKPGADFEVAQRLKVNAENNVLFLKQGPLKWGAMATGAQADSTELDKIEGLANGAERFFRAADSILDISGDNNKEAGNNTHITGKNIRLAEANLKIGQSIRDAIGQLQKVISDAKIANNKPLSMNNRAEAEKKYNNGVTAYNVLIRELVVTADQQQKDTYDNAEQVYNGVIARLSVLGEITGSGNKFQDLNNLFNNLQDYGNKTYPRLKMLVKGDEKRPIDEDFFNFTISVLFPEWPARFQDIGFKACVESLFKYHAPANVKIKIEWLSIKKMRHFEPLYSTWKQNLLTNNNNYGAQHIIAFLNKKHENNL